MLVKASLTRMGLSMVSSSLIWQLYPVPGWGDTGVQETSTDKLQETVVPIVDPSNCAEDVDEDLIVCAGGLGTGPCKVSHQKHSVDRRRRTGEVRPEVASCTSLLSQTAENGKPHHGTYRKRSPEAKVFFLRENAIGLQA